MSGRRANGSNISLTLGLVVVAIVAVVLGYGMGNYAISMLTKPHSAAPKTTPSQVTEQETFPPKSQSETAETAPAAEVPGSAGKQPASSDTPLVVNMDDRESGGQAQPPAGKLFRVQVGAFASKDNARSLAWKLKNMGYQSWITASAPYRVQVGAFSTRDRAEALKQELKTKGFEAVLVVQ